MLAKILSIIGVAVLTLSMVLGVSQAYVNTLVTISIGAAGVIVALIGIFKKKA